MANEAQNKIDAYLKKLHQGLQGMNDADANEIVRELRSHITDKAGTGGELTGSRVDDTLNALGSPETLAKEYITEQILAQTEESRSPMHILHALFRWASLSVAGFFALLGVLSGYSFGLLCMLCALLKPFHPRTAGLWLIPEATGDTNISVRLGFGPAPQGARELLSWWIVPIDLALGFICLLLATSFARWCIRQFRRSAALSRSA